jgi:hypothetical protein
MLVRDADEIERGIATFAHGSNDGLILVVPPSSAQNHRDLIITLAASRRLLGQLLSGLRWSDLLRGRCD